MIFKYYTFEIVPWGAILDIDCTSSSKKAGRVTNWISTTNYQTEYGYLGKDMSYFMESKAEPMSMTYSCTSKNGDLVDIQTNLSCTTSKNSSGIITSFTIDNTNWFNTAYTTESIQIQKVIKKVKITLNNTPYSNTSSYLNFYLPNGNTIEYNSYEDKTFYFDINNNIDENTTLKAVYNYVNEVEEQVTSVADSSSSVYGKVYTSKGIVESISAYNVTKQVNITNYYFYYDNNEQKYYFRIRISSNFEVGNVIKIKYKSCEKTSEDVNTTIYTSGNRGKGYISRIPYSSNAVVVYNITKGVNIPSTSYSGGYDSTEQKYRFLFYVSSSYYAIGDRVRITYYYLNESTENKKVEEDTDSTLHQGTITQHTNLVIEDCLNSNGGFILYERSGNTVFLNTNIYDGKNIIVRYKKEKPYIRLCCDNVKMETAFLSSRDGYSSDFRYLSKDDNYIYPKSGQTGGYAKFLRYIIINWRSQKTQQVYFGMSGQGGLAYCGVYGGSDENNYTRLAYTLNNDTTSLSITTPAVKNLSTPYYSVEYVCNMSGDNYWHWPSRSVKPTLASPIRHYTSDGYIKKLVSGEYSVSGFPTPTIISLNKWGNNSSFYFVGNSYYINPSDGIQLYTNWYDACRDSCDGCGQGCSQGGGNTYTVTVASGGTEMSNKGTYWEQGSICRVEPGTYSIVAYWTSDVPIFVYSGSSTGYAKIP